MKGLAIPNEEVGFVVGKRKAAIRDIRRRSGARIHAIKGCDAIQSKRRRPVSLTGIQLQADEARAMITSKIEVPFMSSTPVRWILSSPHAPTENFQPTAALG